MARKKAKGNASASRSKSKFKNASESAQAEASASSPVTVEETEFEENPEEVMKSEEDGLEVVNSEENVVEQDDGGNAVEKQDDCETCADKQQENAVGEDDYGGDAAEKQEGGDTHADDEKSGDYVVEGEDDLGNVPEKEKGDGTCTYKENNGEEEDEGGNASDKHERDGTSAENEKNGENAAEGGDDSSNADKEKHGENAVKEVSGCEVAEKQDGDDTVVEKDKNGEKVIEAEISKCNVAEKQEKEGTCVDKESNGENVVAYEGKTAECMVDQEEDCHIGAMEKEEIEEENRSNCVAINGDKQEVVEEEKGDENKRELQLGRFEQNPHQQNKKSRKRSRKLAAAEGPTGKVASQSDNNIGLSCKKKLKEGDNHAEEKGQTEDNDAPEAKNKEENSESVKKGKEKVLVDIIDGGENVEENDGKEVGESSRKKVIDLKHLKRKNNVDELALEKMTSKSGGRQGSLIKKKALKKAETMGMIFMCSSKTKQDCYRYRVLGLPAGKRDMVEKIYSGMRLFLYDVDLKMLYGIYKAAGRGGYNIEPKAFDSLFPSQVRFKIIEDCLPLAEEKFKKVIKDNYYTRSKFDCVLNSEQVKNLCKIFVRVSKSKKLGRSARAETKKLNRDRIRRRQEIRRPPLRGESHHHDSPLEVKRPLFRDESLKHESPHEVRQPPLRDEIRQHERTREVRRLPLRDEIRQHEYLHVQDSPVALLPRLPPLPPPLTTTSSAYERTLQREAYRQEPPLERHESYTGSRLLDLQDALRHDPYIERRDVLRQEQLLDPHGSYRREPLLENQDSIRQNPLLKNLGTYRREPLLEQHDSYRREPLLGHRESYRREPLLEQRDSYRREPLLEHSDSYRQSRLLEHRDLYRLDARLEHGESRIPNLERSHQNEIEGRDFHISHRERPSYNDLVYSTSRSLEYHQRVDMPAEGQSIGYLSATGVLRPDYYSRRPAY